MSAQENKGNLKQVFIAHPEKFVSSSIAEFGKLEGTSVYILDELNDFSYLINDLRPDVILVHEKLLSKFQVDFERETLGFSHTRIIVISNHCEKLEIAENNYRCMMEPLSPSHIFAEIKILLESTEKKD